MTVKVFTATQEDHEGILRVAKMSKYTKGVSNPMFLSPKSYERGWVGVVRKAGAVVGFVVVRHLVRGDYTSLYYIGTDPEYQGKGVGSALVRWVFEHSPHGVIQLICEKSNPDSVSWYRTHGFTLDGDGENKSGDPYWKLSCRQEDFTT